jgi:hypothetical protein
VSEPARRSLTIAIGVAAIVLAALLLRMTLRLG